MNKFPFGFFLIIYLFQFSLFGCSRPDKPKPPHTVSDVLNSFIGSAPYQYINLDKVQVQKINLTKDNIIYSLKRKITNGKPFLGSITKVTLVNDHFYIYDAESNAIFEIDMEGNVKGPLTQKGRGPGEQLYDTNLKSNKNYIYANDGLGLRINRYTHEMIPVDPLINCGALYDVNNDIILTGNRNSITNPNQGQIVISPLNNLTDTLATIMPRIIPVGQQPQIFNGTRSSISHHNIIAANYYFLPMFFLFDKNYNHTRTVILKYSTFKKMDIPPMVIKKNSGNGRFGGIPPITEYKLLDNGDILFSIRRELFQLARSQNGTYKVVDKYQFNYALEKKPLWLSDIFPSKNKNEFYVSSLYYLFRVILPT